jgi:hypothetical protein
MEVTRHPAQEQDEMERITLGPKQEKVDGDPFGMHYFTGDEITIVEGKHAPLKITVK